MTEGASPARVNVPERWASPASSVCHPRHKEGEDRHHQQKREERGNRSEDDVHAHS